jgi:hypothetical protein
MKGASIMPEAAASPLSEWESFFVILGSSAAVLTGLVFVAITLIPDDRPRRPDESIGATIDAFSTSTIVHFCAVLFVCAMLSAPWHELSNAGLLLGIAGLAGIAYGLITLRRLRSQHAYSPEFEDWLWYLLVPVVAYAALLVTAILLPNHPRRALFGIGAVTLVLLFLGIRNAWDSVTYNTLQRLQRRSEGDD